MCGIDRYIKIDNQQRPIVGYKDLCSVFYNNLNRKKIWKRINTCKYKILKCMNLKILMNDKNKNLRVFMYLSIAK